MQHENKTDGEVGNRSTSAMLADKRPTLDVIANDILRREGIETPRQWFRYYRAEEDSGWGAEPEASAEDWFAMKPPMFVATCATNHSKVSDEDDGTPRPDSYYLSDWVAFDIDQKEPQDAIESAHAFVRKLEGAGLDTRCLRLYASGKKGFHVLVPLAAFVDDWWTTLEADELRWFPDICKRVADVLKVPGLDFSLYPSGKGKMLRRANVLRDCGTYKVPLMLDEFWSITPALYAEYVSAPRVEVPTVPTEMVEKLAEIWDGARADAVKDGESRSTAHVTPVTPEKIERFKSVIDLIDPDDALDKDSAHTVRRSVAQAAHLELGKAEGFPVFREWAMRSQSRDFKRNEWKQMFKASGKQSGKLVSMGTLIDMVRASGKVWADPYPELNPKHNPAINNDARPIQTELGMAEFLAKKYAPTLRFVEDMGNWLCWNGREWEFDGDGATPTQIVGREARLLLAETLQAQAQEIKAAGDVDGKVLDAIRAKYAATMKFCTSLEGASRIRHVRELLQMQPELRIGSGLLDQCPGLLNLDNGVLNLATGELRAHNADLLLTQRAFVEYAHEAQCPRWLQFMEEICCGDQELVLYLQCVMGYALSGDISRHEAYILHGDGANGKSVLVNTLRALMGGYCKAIDVNALMVRRDGSGPTPDLLAVRGARLVTTSEMSVGRQLNEGVFKDLVSGDTVPVRGMYAKQIIQMQFRCKIFMPTNALPTIAGQDYGVWRRIQPIPFNRTFTEAERDPGLEGKLKAELPGILAWCVAGYQRYKSKGFEAPACVREKKDAYRDDLDIVKHFVADALIQDEAGRQDTGKIPAAVLAQVYEHYCRTMNHPSMGGVRFGREVKKHLTEARRFVAGVKYIGWRVRPSWLPQRLRDELHAESLPEIMDALVEGEVQG